MPALYFLRFRFVQFGMVCLAAVAIFVFQPQKNENQSIENMFSMDDELYESYQSLKRVFGGNEVILIAYRDPQMFSDEGLKRQSQLCELLGEVNGLSGEPMGMGSMIEMIRSFQVDRFRGILKIAGFNLTTEQLISRAKELFSGFTHSVDRQTVAVVVMLQPNEEAAGRRDKIIQSLRDAIGRFSQESNLTSEILMVGEPVMVADGFQMVKKDGLRLGWVSTIALSLVVLVAFRSIRWMLIPVAVVQFSLLATDAAVALMRIQVTIVGSMSTSIITVIAVSTTIHLIICVRRNLREGEPPYPATEKALGQLAAPITFACLTDSIGFGALWFAELEPVQDFATVMFVGSLIVLLTFWAIVPTLALFRSLDSLPFWNLQAEKTRLHQWFGKGLSLPLLISHRFPVIVLLVAASLILFSLVGISRNTIESDFTKNFRSESKIVKSYQFVEENLGGAGVWDVMVKAPRQLDREFLSRIQNLQNRLRSEVLIPREEKPVSPTERNDESPDDGREIHPGLTKVLSLVDAIESLSGKPINEFANAHLTIGLGLMKGRIPEFYNSLFAEDPDRPGVFFYRIMLRSLERTSSEQKKGIIDHVNRLCREEFPESKQDDVPEIQTTGFYVLLTYMIDSVIRDQWKTFGIAALGIVLMLMFSLGDIRLALIGLLPNLIPILMLLGSFGWLGIPINLGIALIAAVAIGLSIDSSIHYIYDFQRHRRECPVSQAVMKTQDQVGRALVYSTFALVVGFSSLCTSEFLPTVYFGGTAMIAMAGGLVGNLFLLPLFIGILYRDEAQREIKEEANGNQGALKEDP